jgi:hypothetical protein
VEATIEKTIEDLAGNPLAEKYSWYFSTVTPPLILKVKPSEDSRNNQPPDKISVIFNEPLAASSVTPNVLKVYDSAGFSLDGIVTYDNETYTVLFEPTEKLMYNSVYNAFLFNFVIDLQGNHLETNLSWQFSTGSPEDPENKMSNIIFLSIIYAVIFIIIIIVLLIGTGKIQLKKYFGKDLTDEEARELPPPPPPPAEGDVRGTVPVEKRGDAVKKRKIRSARAAKTPREAVLAEAESLESFDDEGEDEDLEDYDDEIQQGWVEESEDEYDSWGEEDEEEEPKDEDKSITVEWQDD